MKSLRQRKKNERPLRSSQSNRGMDFEELLNFSNAQYQQKGWARIEKIATPFKQVGVHKQGVFLAVRDHASTVDYFGIFDGRAIVFEAKQTKETTRFPFDNLHEHQVAYLRQAEKLGAVSFVLIEFSRLEEVYLVNASYIVEMWDAAERGGRKSISIDNIRHFGDQVTSGRGVALDYLSVVERRWKRTRASSL